MTKIINILVIVGFLMVDWLIFHDFLKMGEQYTFTEYLTGILSIFVFLICARSLFKGTARVA